MDKINLLYRIVITYCIHFQYMRYGCCTKRALPFTANSPDGAMGKNCVCAILAEIVIHSTTTIQFRNKVNKYDYVLI